MATHSSCDLLSKMALTHGRTGKTHGLVGSTHGPRIIIHDDFNQYLSSHCGPLSTRAKRSTAYSHAGLPQRHPQLPQIINIVGMQALAVELPIINILATHRCCATAVQSRLESTVSHPTTCAVKPMGSRARPTARKSIIINIDMRSAKCRFALGLSGLHRKVYLEVWTLFAGVPRKTLCP